MSLEKMIIREKGGGDEFEALVNPNSVKWNINLNYTANEASGKDSHKQKFDRTDPEKLTFSLILDGTGAILNRQGEVIVVQDEIAKLKTVILEYKKEKHEPNDVEIVWGELEFECILKSLDIDYTMFDQAGKVLRAKVNCSFEGTTPVKEQASTDRKSPDLSHLREVLEGDTLPLMCQRVYGDSRYYLEVARINNIVNFRQLEPGTEILFPPVKK